MTHVSSAPSTLVIRRLMPASRAEVFAAWTDANSLRQWMCPPGVTRTTAELDARVGGRYRIVMHGEKKDYDHHGSISSSIRHRSCRSPGFRRGPICNRRS